MSGFLFEALPQKNQGNLFWYGTVAETVEDLNERVMVIVPDWSISNQFGPCFWQSRDATSMPQRGNRCLVVLDNRRQPWVIAWWPFDT